MYLDKRLMRPISSNPVPKVLRYSSADKPVRISRDCTGEVLALNVRDQAIVLPESDRKHWFEPFQRAANVGIISGTELGIFPESVELHGGTIAVESPIGVGTTFVVVSPQRSSRTEA